MLPWNVIIRVLTPIATTIAGRMLTNPDTVNKIANSGAMRQIARSAARMKVKAENAIETQPELQKLAKEFGKDFKSGKR